MRKLAGGSSGLRFRSVISASASTYWSEDSITCTVKRMSCEVWYLQLDSRCRWLDEYCITVGRMVRDRDEIVVFDPS